MPQLDIYSYISQILVIFSYFYIFLFCVYFFIYFWNFQLEILRKDFFFLKITLKKISLSGIYLTIIEQQLYGSYQQIYLKDFFYNR